MIWLSMKICVICSTLTVIIFLHYRVATKMALEILGYSMCRVRLWWFVSLPLNWYIIYRIYLAGGRWSYFSRKFTVRVLVIWYDSYQIFYAWYQGLTGTFLRVLRNCFRISFSIRFQVSRKLIVCWNTSGWNRWTFAQDLRKKKRLQKY